MRGRLRAGELSFEAQMAESPERIEAAYHERAVRLAKGQAEHGRAAGGQPVLVFRLALERYAIELKEVGEVTPLTRCTPVPGASPRFAGVISLRGELRSVLDLGRLLEIPESGKVESGFVLVLRRQEMGLKVDRIEELREIQSEELSHTAPAKYVKGICPGTPMLLDVDAVLAEIFSAEKTAM